jgi:TolB-like protein/DNA-binding winged helix-turn-helix (wHTH) protein/Tfp pilus assembly protein PilF
VAAAVFEFGDFRLDSGRFELSREGRSLRLERKPMELLLLLVQSKGNLVTRAEIAQRLWDSEVFVDTEHGINTAIRKIRQALRDDPESPLFIQTVPGMGYRFIASIAERPTAGPISSEPAQTESKEIQPAVSPTLEPIAAPIPVADRPARRIWLLGGLAAIVLLVALVVSFYPSPLATRLLHPGTPAIHSIAVLPLDNFSADPTQSYFADGMTDELITMLAKNSSIRITSRTSVMQYKGAHRPLPQIARELGVDGILEGSITRSPERVHLTLQLIRADTDTHLWAESYDRSLTDVAALPSVAARDIANRLHSSTASPASERYVDPAAHDAYLRGRYFFEKREVDKSVAYFKQAIAIDPNWSAAYAGLAQAWQSEAVLFMTSPAEAATEAEAAARRALELDPENGEAYSTLGLVQSTLEWKWAEAEPNLKRGIALSPSSSYAELDYAIYLDAVNRPEDAVTHMRKALQLDPQSFLMNRHLGSALYFARHYDEALVHLKQAVEMEPDKPGFTEEWFSNIYEKKGMRDQAADADALALQGVSPGTLERLRALYKRSGWDAYWKARLKMSLALGDKFCGPYDSAITLLRLGKPDAAFPLFNRAADQKCYEVSWIVVDPLADSARTDRRYGDLVKRMNLSQ